METESSPPPAPPPPAPLLFLHLLSSFSPSYSTFSCSFSSSSCSSCCVSSTCCTKMWQYHQNKTQCSESLVPSVRHLLQVRTAADPQTSQHSSSLPNPDPHGRTGLWTDGQSETAERACGVQFMGDALNTCRRCQQLFSSMGRFLRPEGGRAQQPTELWEERKERRKEEKEGGAKEGVGKERK